MVNFKTHYAMSVMPPTSLFLRHDHISFRSAKNHRSWILYRSDPIDRDISSQDTLLQSHRSRRYLESLVGLLNFASSLVPLGHLRLRPIISWINSHTSPNTRDRPVSLDRSLKKLLVTWTDQTFLTSPVHMNLPIPCLQLMTDSRVWYSTRQQQFCLS